MKYYKLLVLIMLLFFGLEPMAQVKHIGNTDDLSANEMTVDAKDNIYASGSFSGHMIVDKKKLESSGQKDVFLASFNQNMKTRWIKSFGGENDEYANALFTRNNGNNHVLITYVGQTTIDGITLEAESGTDVMIIDISPDGEIIKAQSLLVDGNPMGEDLVIDREGNYYILIKVVDEIEIKGATYKPAATEEDARVLVKTNPDGEILWVKKMDGIEPNSNAVIKIGPKGHIYAAGTFSRTLTIEDNKEVANGNTDAFIAKISPEGVLQWLQRSRGEGEESTRDIGIAVDGSVYQTGYYTQEAVFETEASSSVADKDIFLVRYESDGNVRWLRAASGGFQDDKSNNLIIGNNGDVHLTGNYTDGITFYDQSISGAADSEIFIATYAADGIVKKLKRAGGSGTDQGIDVEILSNDKIVTYGEFTDVATFGNETVKSLGETDLYIWKF